MAMIAEHMLKFSTIIGIDVVSIRVKNLQIERKQK